MSTSLNCSWGRREELNLKKIIYGEYFFGFLPLYPSNLRSWNHLTPTYRSRPEMTLEIILTLGRGNSGSCRPEVQQLGMKFPWLLDKIYSPFLEARFQAYSTGQTFNS